MNSLGIKKWLALSLHNQVRKNLTRIHNLDYLFWECTLRCNYACLHCASDCSKDAVVNDMPLKDFLKAIDSIVPHVNPNEVTIGITGGEPLLRSDLEQCGLELNKRGFPWGFVTNGYLLTEKRFNNFINAGLGALTISLDGLEQTHNWLRPTINGYKKTLQAISLAAQADKLAFDVVTCVNKRNLNELTAIKELLVKLKVKRWRVSTIFPVGRAKDYPDLLLTNKEFVELLEFIKKTRKEGQIIANYGCEGYLGVYENEVRDNFFHCQAGINVGSILADGSISACPSLRNKFIQGNIYEDDFMEVWNTKYEIMRDRTWTKTGKCKACKSYKYCEGNGLHLRDEFTDEVLVCHLEKIEDNETIGY
jgi:radical SAM enzyme (rSAM/lipoprotein system)